MSSNNVYGTLTNVDSVPLTVGMVVRVTGANGVRRAQADSPAHLQGLAGVVDSGSVGVNGPAANVVGSAIRQIILLETGLTPAAGETLYVSAAVAGRATNIAPVMAVAVGTIVDVSAYSRNSTVYASVSVPAAAAGPANGLLFYVGAVDLMTAGFYNIDIPPQLTSRWSHYSARIEVLTRDAALTTGLTYGIAQNGVDLPNLFPFTVSAALLNQYGPPGSAVASPSSGPHFDVSVNPIQLHVITPVAGAGLSTCTGLYVTSGIWMPP